MKAIDSGTSMENKKRDSKLYLLRTKDTEVILMGKIL